MDINLQAKKLVNVNDLTGEEWLLWRKRGIGGSNAGTLVGVNGYDCKLNLYLDKTDPDYIEDEKSPELQEAAEMGHLMEPFIRNLFQIKNPGWEVVEYEYMLQSERYYWMLANLDGLIRDPENPDKGWGVLEIKNMSEHRKDEFGEKEIPIQFIIQMMHYLIVTGLKWGKFAIVIGGNKYREFTIEYNEKIANQLIMIERNFWEEHVLKEIPPEPDGTEASEKALVKMFPASKTEKKSKIKELPAEAKGLIESYEFYSAQEKEAKAKKDTVKQQIQAELGAYQTGHIAGDTKKIHWTVQKEFDENKLKSEKPEIYQEFTKQVIDKTQLKKAYPKLYKEFMLDSKTRKFTYK